MNSKVIISSIILIVIVIVLVVLKFCVFKEKPKVDSKNLVLTYKIQAGIPFKWDVKVEDPTIVKLEKSYVVKDENVGAITGAAVYTNYEFKGLKEGKTTITFTYLNFVDNVEYEKEKHEVIVDKDLKVTEIKK